MMQRSTISVAGSCATAELNDSAGAAPIRQALPIEAFGVFFGPTPASGADGVPGAASKVNLIGQLCCKPPLFKSASDGDRIRTSLQD